jgi:hypothetical protein
MQRHFALQQASPIDAAEFLTHLAGDLAGGEVEIDGGRFHISGPIDATIDVDLTTGRVTLNINLECHRPMTASNLLYQELVHPGD